MEKKNNKVSSRKSLSRKVVMRDIMRDIKSLFIAAPISRITTLRDDEVRPCPRFARAASTGMTNGAECGFPSPLAGEGARRAGEGYKKAFTLIEVLVVVLIIGILAAVALPQYQFAVDKSRVIPYMQQVQDLLKAQQVYFLANGEYAANITDLDIDFFSQCTQANCFELRKCPGNISLNIPTGEVNNKCVFLGTGGQLGLEVSYCARGSENCRLDTNRDMGIFFSLQNGTILSCNYWSSARGKKLCNYFTKQFGTSN